VSFTTLNQLIFYLIITNVLNNLLDITKPINVNSNQRQTNVAVDWSSLAVIVKSTLMSISIRIIWVDIFKVNMSLPKINSVYLRGCYTIHTGNGIILPLFVLGKKNNIYIYIYIYMTENNTIRDDICHC